MPPCGAKGRGGFPFNLKVSLLHSTIAPVLKMLKLPCYNTSGERERATVIRGGYQGGEIFENPQSYPQVIHRVIHRLSTGVSKWSSLHSCTPLEGKKWAYFGTASFRAFSLFRAFSRPKKARFCRISNSRGGLPLPYFFSFSRLKESTRFVEIPPKFGGYADEIFCFCGGLCACANRF